MDKAQSQIPINNVQAQPQSHQQFTTPITFIWYGPQVPQDYMIRLATLPYPLQFLKNPPITHHFNRQLKLIQKADYYRLQYIYQNGGIYSDFDNKIDYKCMVEVLDGYKESEKVIFWWQPKRNFQARNVVPSSFIYAPKPKMQAMKKILQNINEQNRDLKFAGMQYLSQFANQQLIQVKQLYNCIQHEYDFSWVKQLGKTSGQRGEKQQLVNKKRKKTEIASELQKIKKQKVQLKREYDIIMEKYKETQGKLLKEYKRHYVGEGEGNREESKEMINKKGDEVIMNKQITQDEVIRNSKVASINDSQGVNSKQVVSKNNLEESTMNTMAQKQTVQANKQQQVPPNQTSQQPHQQLTRGSINTPFSNPYQSPVQSSAPVYSGQGLKFVDAQQQVKNLHINKKIPSYKMDDTLMSSFVLVVIVLVLVLVLGFIWMKFKKYQRYAQVGFQLERKVEEQRKLRAIEEDQKRKSVIQRLESGQMNSQRGMNEENEALSARQ